MMKIQIWQPGDDDTPNYDDDNTPWALGHKTMGQKLCFQSVFSQCVFFQSIFFQPVLFLAVFFLNVGMDDG